MNRFAYFLAVGLAFTVLQVATVEAQDMAPATDCAATPGGPEAVAACWDAQNATEGGMAPGTAPMCGDVPCPTGDAEGMHSHEGMAPGTVALTIGDPKCVVAPALRDPDCPNAMPGTGATMAPPAGNGMNRMPGAAPMAPPGTSATGEDCAAEETPALVAACWDRSRPPGN